MDALRAITHHGPHDLRPEGVGRPQPGPWKGVMRVRAGSIGATDLRTLNHGHV